jgi:multidrug efflux pump subunit AcrA (membrane-fusion protein)
MKESPPLIEDDVKDAEDSEPLTDSEAATRSSTYSSDEERERRRARRVGPLSIALIIALACLLIISVIWFVRGRNQEGPEESVVAEVEVAYTARREMREYVESGGTLNAMPGREASFSAAVGGRVTRVLVQAGERVRAGQTLAELDRSVLAAQVRQAEAALQQARATAAQALAASGAQSQTIASDQIRQAEVALTQARANQTQAQSNLARVQRLFERGIAARKEVEEAQTQVTVANAATLQAQSALAAARVNATRGVGEARTQASVSAGGVNAAAAALALAQAELGRAAIRSPINGTVTRRAINDGETVDPATPVFEVIDDSSLDLVANLPAEYLDRVRTGNLAVVKVEPFPEREFDGGVVNVAPSVDPQTNTVAVRVRLPNPSGELKAGLYANARLAVEIHTGALVVPESALVVAGDETFVFVTSDGEKVSRRKVSVGIRDEGLAEITDGLKESERVVTTGAFGLGDGARVKIAEPQDEEKKSGDAEPEASGGGEGK